MAVTEDGVAGSLVGIDGVVQWSTFAGGNAYLVNSDLQGDGSAPVNQTIGQFRQLESRISYLDRGQEVPLDALAAELSEAENESGGAVSPASTVSRTQVGGGPAVRRRSPAGQPGSWSWRSRRRENRSPARW